MKLKVSYHKQEKKNWCFPACIQMVLEYHEIKKSQKELYTIGKWKKGTTASFNFGMYLIGIGFSMVSYHGLGDWLTGTKKEVQLTKKAISKGVKYRTNASIALIKHYLRKRVPVVAELNPEKLYKSKDTESHVIVLTGFNNKGFYCNDPYKENINFIKYPKFNKCWDGIQENRFMNYKYTRNIYVILKK